MVLYDVGRGRYRRVTSFGRRPVWTGDEQYLLFWHEAAIWRVHRDGGEARELFAYATATLGDDPSIAADGRRLVVSVSVDNERIWRLLTEKE